MKDFKDPNIIIEEIDRLLEFDLEDKKYDYIASLQNSLSDAVTVQIGFNSEFESSYFPHDEESREGYILNHLGHLSANPSDPDKKDWLMNAYIYPMGSFNEELDEKLRNPNINAKTSENFINELIYESRREWNMYVNTSKQLRNVHILHGDRGIGKTVFINHLFTKYNDFLNQNNIIWIRITLAEDFDSDDPDLFHWILSKITLVVFRYYIGKDDRFDDVIPSLNNYIKTSFPKDQQHPYFENLRQCQEIFSEGKVPIKLNSKLVNKLLARDLLDILIKKDFSFIFILDSFDRLDITPKYYKKFQNVRSKINELVNPDTNLGGCYLIVTRSETLKFFGHYNAHATSKITNNIIKEIVATPFQLIINERINYLKKKISSLSKNKYWEMSDWPIHIEEFANYLVNISETEHFNNFIKNIDNIYGSNNRAKVQLIQLCYYNFLRSKKYPKRYKLIEYMCKGGYEYPPKYYYYGVQKKSLVPIAYSKVFDNVFLPTLFRFPYDQNFLWEDLPYSKTYLLAGFRIIEFLANTSIKQFPISVNVLFNKLKKLYRYNEEIIYNLLEEFAEYGLIMLGGASHLSDRPEIFHIFVTPKLIFVYGKLISRSILTDIAYLNMCAMRTLVNREALEDKMPFFKALNLDDEKITVTTWSIWKIINTISLFRLIKKAYYLEERQSLYSIHPFLDYLKNSISKQIKNIVNEMNEDKRKKLFELLKIYEQKWCIDHIN